jgi:glutaredoxin|tara:strand:+ start:357 stop:1085 length:729 start_codon:yes stop_codon:yes gene_type:complete
MTKKATVYRMVMDKHICPYGLKSIDLLKTQGYEVEDHHITSREETDAFKEKHDVKTTPQTFIDGERIGGHDDLKEFFGKKQEGTTYKPIIAIFATTLLMALSTAWAIDAMNIIRVIEFFIAISMCVLGIQKLRDLEAFSLQFLNYDLLAQRWVKYGYVYPFVETLAGVAMISGFLTIISAPAALFIGTVGAISVFKAVYIDKRELKCACVGENSNVPLGFVSLTENLMMIAMSFWMLSKYIG